MQNPDQQKILKLFKQYSRDPIECKNCHKQFTPIHPSQVFCCRECAKEHHTQEKVTKSEEKFNRGRGRVYSLDMNSWNWKRKKH
jgi:protein-arginine kinase activator protein McsA